MSVGVFVYVTSDIVCSFGIDSFTDHSQLLKSHLVTAPRFSLKALPEILKPKTCISDVEI